MRGTQPAAASGGPARVLWLGWLVFVVYGSLVPLDFHTVPLADALNRFAHIPWLQLGVQSRADWIANGVLYLPGGFLLTLVLGGYVPGRRLVAGLAALMVGAALAVVVEFTQLYFPPRTVSLNDLLAECLGCMLGVLLAWVVSGWLPAGRALLEGQGQRASAWLVTAGALLLAVSSLFPFDLLISADELTAKLQGPFWGWWKAPLFADESWYLTVARLLAEALAVALLGAWWARTKLTGSMPRPLGALLWRGALLGAGLGLVLEVGQWFIASGVSQGQSVLSRALGGAFGAWVGYTSRDWGLGDWQVRLRRWTFPLSVVFLLTAVAKAGWVSGPWRSMGEAWTRLTGGEVRFLPFYYHYFTSEGAAVQSVVPVLLLFAPVGLLCWAWGRTPALAAGLAALAASLVEAGRLFAVDSRPDPSNVLIAAAAAALSVWLLQRITMAPVSGAASATRAELTPVLNPSVSPMRQSGWRSAPLGGGPGMGSLALLIATAGLALTWLLHFPVYQLGVGLMLLTGAALVWWRPVLLLAVAAATLPLLNLSIWSGREFVDEFDVLLVVCLAVAWARRPVGAAALPRDSVLGISIVLVTFSVLISTLLGWAPWDAAALQNPHGPLSPWYTVRLFKGALLAALLCAVARRQHAAGEPVAHAFGVGMVAGLAGVLIFVVWERMAFVGLLNFSDAYRVAGPVLPMRLGGAYLDAFLVVSLPFALIGVLHAKTMAWRALCICVALGTVYAMAVTFTRSTYLAVLVVGLLVTLGALRPWPLRGGQRVWQAGGVLVLLAAAAYPIITGPFASERLAVVSRDMETRLGHARYVVALGGGDAVATWFGKGLGRFPAVNYWARQSARATSGGMAVHHFLRKDGISQLQLGAGPVLFLDQAVISVPQQNTQIDLKVRSTGPDAKLVVMLCHKWLLSSDSCDTQTMSVPGPDKGWQRMRATLQAKTVGHDSGLVARPIRLTLHNAGLARIDLDSVSLRDEQGFELISNGDFDAGSDHWNFTSDDHLAWHVKNMPLAVWFDMGWFGVLAFGMLLTLALLRSAGAAWTGNRSSQALFAALSGLMIVSVFDSIVDEPRFLLLLLILAWLASNVPTGQTRVLVASR